MTTHKKSGLYIFTLCFFYLQLVGIIACLIFAVPVFAEMFADFDAELPYPTQILLDIALFTERWIFINL